MRTRSGSGTGKAAAAMTTTKALEGTTSPAEPSEPLTPETGVTGRPGEYRPTHSTARVVRRAGLGLQAGGGITDFARSEMQVLSDTGGFWEARVVMGTRRFFGFEAGYVGAAHPLSDPGLGAGARLMGHGAEAALRLNLPLEWDSSFITPFAFAGLGWQRYRIHGGNGAGEGRFMGGADDVAVIPVGGGVAMGHGHLYVDARAAVRFTEFDDLLRDPATGQGQLRQWTFGASVGYLF